MPETKNNFIKAKMNQDLDDRLVPTGEYRVGQNVTINRSEGDGVGTFQNILGNESIYSIFNLTDVENLEVIGYIVNPVSDDIYFFCTNYNDSSPDQLSNFSQGNASHFIGVYNTASSTGQILVQGLFLNFSKTHPILGVNLIEDLLFWTDNRNQPRKINARTARSNSNYYDSEDKISVVKYYPFKPPQFYYEIIRQSTVDIVNSTNILLGKCPGVEVGMQVLLPDDSYTTTGIYVNDVFINANGDCQVVVNSPISVDAGSDIKFVSYTLKNCGEKWLPTEYFTETLTAVDVAAGEYSIQLNRGSNPIIDATGVMYISNIGEDPIITKKDEFYISNINNNIITIENSFGNPPPDLDGKSAIIYRINPNYDEEFAGDKEFLKDKFIRFSYRFKFDDNEYSLMAPFTQAAFIPSNFGSFVDDNEANAAKSSVLKFFENFVDCIDIIIPSPLGSKWSDEVQDLNITQVQILCKFSDENAIKVIDNLDSEAIFNYSSLSGVLGNDNIIKYNYKSQKPIRVLPEKEVTRVYDQAPIRALSQESAGNRIIYGNFIDKHTSPELLSYKVSTSSKVDNSTNRAQYSHSLKQNRTYQVGLVLSDRYGRQSDVILSSVQDSVVISGKKYGGATSFNPYADDNKFSAQSILDWFGDQLILYVDGVIPQSISKEGYPGLYSETNPLGFYSYKVVVKQQEQDYYNVYAPNAYLEDQNELSYSLRNSYISLVNDNINKVPKDLTQVGPEDREFRSSVNLFPRVNPTNNIPGIVNTETFSCFYETSSKANIVDSIFQNTVFNTTTGSATTVEVNYEKFYKGKTALLAKVDNKEPYGTEYSTITTASDTWNTLGVLETKPVFSNLDIYWETTTSGLISELNEQVENGDLGPVSLTEDNFVLFEDSYLYSPGANPPLTVTGDILYTFEFRDGAGAVILDPNALCAITYVSSTITPPNVNLAPYFVISPQVDNLGVNTGRFELYSNVYWYFGSGYNLNFTISATANNSTNSLSIVGAVSNRVPQFGERLNPPCELYPPNQATPDADKIMTALAPFGAISLNTIPYTTTNGVNVPAMDLKSACYEGAFQGDNDLPNLNNSNFEMSRYGMIRSVGKIATDEDKQWWTSFLTNTPDGFYFDWLQDPTTVRDRFPRNFPYANADTTAYIEDNKFYFSYTWLKGGIPPSSPNYSEANWKVLLKPEDLFRFNTVGNGGLGPTNGTLLIGSQSADLSYELEIISLKWEGDPGDGPDGTLQGAATANSLPPQYFSELEECFTISQFLNGQLYFDDNLFWNKFGAYSPNAGAVPALQPPPGGFVYSMFGYSGGAPYVSAPYSGLFGLAPNLLLNNLTFNVHITDGGGSGNGLTSTFTFCLTLIP